MPHLQAQFQICYSKHVKVTADINYSRLEPGVIVVLYGPSGSGKSTILRGLAGLEKLSTGQIQFGNQIWADANQHICLSPQKRRIGFLFQDYALFPHLRVLSNIIYGLGSMPKHLQIECGKSMMQTLQLSGLEHRFPKELSGGQQQRVALARTLVCQPTLLLLDEPFSALDQPTRESLQDELKALIKKMKIPTIMVTHDLREALVLADEMIICSEGRTIQNGSPSEVLAYPKTATIAKIVGVDNILSGKVVGIHGKKRSIQIGDITVIAAAVADVDQTVALCVRAEEITVFIKEGTCENPFKGILAKTQEEGCLVRLIINCGIYLKTFVTRHQFLDMGLKEGGHVFFSINEDCIHIIA